MKAATAENRAGVLKAEALVPKSIGEALRAGRMQSQSEIAGFNQSPKKLEFSGINNKTGTNGEFGQTLWPPSADSNFKIGFMVPMICELHVVASNKPV